MFVIVVFALLVVTALVGTVLEMARDGYGRIPTREA